jgi:HEAT repeat protein
MFAVQAILVGLLAGSVLAADIQSKTGEDPIALRIDDTVAQWRALPDPDPIALSKELIKFGRAGEAYFCERLKRADETDLMIPLTEALGQVGSTIRSVQVLGGVLDSKNAKFRECSVRALGCRGTVEAVPYLLVALDDRSQTVRASAAEVLEDFHRSMPSLRILRRLRKLQRTIQHTDQFALLLGRMGTEEAREILRGLLNFGSGEDNMLAGLSGLWIAGQAEDAEDVLRLLNSQPTTPVRRKACLVLGHLRYSESIRDLIDYLYDDHPGLVSDAHWALSEITHLRLPADVDLWEAWWERVGSQDQR